MILFKYIVVLLTITFSAQTSDCKKLFPGKWKYKNVPVEESYVVRTLDRQFEYVENGKYYYEFRIKWLNDCKYELTYAGTTSPDTSFAKHNETCTVQIIGIDNDYMKYKTIFRNQLDVNEMERIK
jgi:hypothetical protein